MMDLSLQNIKLNTSPATKEEALTQIGELLIELGYIAPEYAASFAKREAIANTYLGQKIAIPHGVPKDRDYIQKTGIVVLQIPEGVDWGNGKQVKLAVGIAAKSDEHITILANLTHLLDKEDLVEQLGTTEKPEDILYALENAKSLGKKKTTQNLADYEGPLTHIIQNKHGLHARPATYFTNIAKEFSSDIIVQIDNRQENGKSLAGLLKLEAAKGTQIDIYAKGEDAEQALSALTKALKDGLGEQEQEPKAEAVHHDWKPKNVEETSHGCPASPGLAVGKVFKFLKSSFEIEEKAENIETEKNALQAALKTATEDLKALYTKVRAQSGAGQATIFQAHQAFIEDPDILTAVTSKIDTGKSAAFAWNTIITERVNALQTNSDPHFAARAIDLQDVGRRVLELLVGHKSSTENLPTSPVILLSDDLTPSDTVSLDPKIILGICSAKGGPTSHSAIIARSLDIPSIVALGDDLLSLADDTTVIVDGTNGELHISPSEEDIISAEEIIKELSNLRSSDMRHRFEPALTTDGARILVGANIGSGTEAAKALDAGGEGVGLMRTEFLFLERQTPPSEEEQFEIYKQAAEGLNGLPLIIRTLDIGGDKEVPYLNLPAEANPFLGERGIRLCLNRPDLFLTQLRAIYRAAEFGNILIMFPMISTVGELKQAKEIAEKIQKDLNAPRLKIGIMIEVPSAVILAPELAKIADFFSIGTNDLTQYVMATDRGHPTLATKASSLHPAVLRMIKQTVDAANTAHIWTGVCGGLAGDPLGAAILAGLGVQELSMAIPAIASIKAKLRSISLKEAQELAETALHCESDKQVRKLHFPL